MIIFLYATTYYNQFHIMTATNSLNSIQQLINTLIQHQLPLYLVNIDTVYDGHYNMRKSIESVQIINVNTNYRFDSYSHDLKLFGSLDDIYTFDTDIINSIPNNCSQLISLIKYITSSQSDNTISSNQLNVTTISLYDFEYYVIISNQCICLSNERFDICSNLIRGITSSMIRSHKFKLLNIDNMLCHEFCQINNYTECGLSTELVNSDINKVTDSVKSLKHVISELIAIRDGK